MKEIWYLIVGGILINTLRKKTASVGAIYSKIPEVFACNDGTFSTAPGKRGCARHGGKKSEAPILISENTTTLLNIRDVPLSEIRIDTTLFQGRQKKFSDRSVQNIIDDVQSGKFIWENLDPISLWEDPKGNLYLLGGHSRTEAFNRLKKMGAKVDGKGFDRIPAKIFKNISADTAKTVALESNTLSTKETDIERAAYYRRLRQDGTPEKNILESIKKNEGKNWLNIYAFTFLSPSGSAWHALQQFSESEDQSANLAKSLTRWIGTARRNFPLTNQHEQELYQWLFLQGGYGTGRNQVKSEREFLDKVKEFVQKNTFFGQFDQEKPLNIFQQLTKSPVEIEYDRQIEDASREVMEADKDLKGKIKQLADMQATKSDAQRILVQYEARVRNARLNLQRLLQQKERVIEYSKNEPALFGRYAKMFNTVI